MDWFNQHMDLASALLAVEVFEKRKKEMKDNEHQGLCGTCRFVVLDPASDMGVCHFNPPRKGRTLVNKLEEMYPTVSAVQDWCSHWQMWGKVAKQDEYVIDPVTNTSAVLWHKCSSCGCYIKEDEGSPFYEPTRREPWRHETLYHCHLAMKARIAELENELKGVTK